MKSKRSSASRAAPAVVPSVSDEAGRADESERELGRYVAIGLPLAALVAALLVAFTWGLGPAILTLAAGALLGTISLFWASLRTLSGDAPLAEGFGAMEVRTSAYRSDAVAEEKRTALRALKDLEFEHSVGKIDDADYAELAQRYRESAKAMMREADVAIDPLRERAEHLARSYLAKRGLEADDVEPPTQEMAASTQKTVEREPGRSADKPTAATSTRGGAPQALGASSAPSSEGPIELSTMRSRPAPPLPKLRVACQACRVSNEPDAVFCKGCGATLRTAACPSCRVVNEIDAAFCKKCGAPLPGKTEGTDAPA